MKFKPGDKVRRSTLHQGGQWKTDCLYSGVSPDDVVTVKSCSKTILSLEEVDFSWETDEFELATPQEVKYTLAQITEKIIGYKSSATPQQRATLITSLTNFCRDSHIHQNATIPNKDVIRIVHGLPGVCDEGKKRFVREFKLEKPEPPLPAKVEMSFQFKPGKLTNNQFVDVCEKVKKYMRELGLAVGDDVLVSSITVDPPYPTEPKDYTSLAKKFRGEK